MAGAPRPTARRFTTVTVAAEPAGRALVVGVDDDGDIIATRISEADEVGDAETIDRIYGAHRDVEVGLAADDVSTVVWADWGGPPDTAMTLRASVYR